VDDLGTWLTSGQSAEDVLEKIRRLSDLVDAAERLWPAYEVYVSAGSTPGAFKRHLWPVIRDVGAILSRDKVSAVRYAVGYEDAPNSYGMAHGPFLTYEECVDVWPNNDRPAFIIKFDPVEGDHPVARWDDKRGRWRSY